MSKDIILSIVDILTGIVIEGIILTMVFQWISNKSQEKQQQNLQREMQNIEKQNKFDFEQLQQEIRQCKQDILSEIKQYTQEKPPKR